MRSSDCKRLVSSIHRAARERSAPALAMSLLLIFAAPGLAANGDYSADIGGATAESAVADLLQNRGLTPPAGGGLSIGDYIETSAGQKGAREVWVSMDADGHIIPASDWQRQHPEYCKERARDTAAAAQRLRFRLVRNAETLDGKTRYQYDVFAGVIDQASGKIKSQQEGQSTLMRDSNAKSGFSESPDATGLAAPMDDALDRLNIKLGALVGPCGDIRLQHLSGNQVGAPAEFMAGFQGSSGRYLSYTWDFGDGSAPEEIGQRARHVYARNGTYAVTVKVQGKNIEPGSKTISVVIGGDLTLSFSSRIEQKFPDGRFMQEFQSTVPLATGADSIFEGKAPLRSVEMENTYQAEMLTQLHCSLSPRDGVLEVRATLPQSMGESAAGIDVSLNMPFDKARPLFKSVPGVEVRCPPVAGFAAMMTTVLDGMGANWWLGYRMLHEKDLVGPGEVRFVDWQTSKDPTVIASKTFRREMRLDEDQTLTEITTVELRRGSDR